MGKEKSDKNHIFSTSVVQLHLHVLGSVSFSFSSKPCSLSFYITNSFIPPTFLLKNVFLYLFPLFFNLLIVDDICKCYKC